MDFAYDALSNQQLCEINVIPKRSAFWLALAAILPSAMMAIIQYPLEFDPISRAMALVSPYLYFVIVCGVCLLPSHILLAKNVRYSAGVTLVIAALTVFYIPVLIYEYFAFGCILLNDCHKL